MSILPIQYTVKRLDKDELKQVSTVGMGAALGTPTIVVPSTTVEQSGEVGVVVPPVVPVVPAPDSIVFASAPFEDGTTPADKQKPGTQGYQYQTGETLPDGSVYGSPKPNMLPLLAVVALALWVIYG